MSFDVYVQFFVAGRESGVPEDSVRAAFPGLVEVLDEDYWLLRFDADTTTDLFLRLQADDPARIHCLSFHRPADDARLWTGIWTLLATPGAAFHFPGATSTLVREADSMRDVPEALGGVRVVTDLQALPAAIAIVGGPRGPNR